MCFYTVRRVDTEEPDRLPGMAALHHDRVAVEHLHDPVFEVGRAPLLTEPPPQHRGGGQHGDHDHGPGADHPSTLPGPCDTEQGHHHQVGAPVTCPGHVATHPLDPAGADRRA